MNWGFFCLDESCLLVTTVLLGFVVFNDSYREYVVFDIDYKLCFYFRDIKM